MSSIEKVFKNLKKENKKALITYSVAGDPDLESSEKIIRNFILEGVDIIEVGVPFSDPMAEGPSIQLGHERALKNKISLLDIMQMCLNVKNDHPNIIECVGPETINFKEILLKLLNLIDKNSVKLSNSTNSERYSGIFYCSKCSTPLYKAENNYQSMKDDENT